MNQRHADFAKMLRIKCEIVSSNMYTEQKRKYNVSCAPSVSDDQISKPLKPQIKC